MAFNLGNDRRLKSFECQSTVSQYHLRKYLNHYKQTVDRNTDFKGVDGKDLEANEGHVIKNRKKRHHFSGKHLAELCFTIM